MLSIVLNLVPGFNNTKSNPRRQLPSREFLLVGFEFPAIAPFIFIAVFEPCTKKLLDYDTENDAVTATVDTAFI